MEGQTEKTREPFLFVESGFYNFTDTFHIPNASIMFTFKITNGYYNKKLVL